MRLSTSRSATDFRPRRVHPIRRVYFKPKGRTVLTAVADFIGVTTSNCSEKRLRGCENDTGEFYYGFTRSQCRRSLSLSCASSERATRCRIPFRAPLSLKRKRHESLPGDQQRRSKAKNQGRCPHCGTTIQLAQYKAHREKHHVATIAELSDIVRTLQPLIRFKGALYTRDALVDGLRDETRRDAVRRGVLAAI